MERNTRLIERVMLDAIIDCLDAHQISVTEFRQQQTTIINSGLLITGGAVVAHNLAVGKRARNTVSHLTQPHQEDNPS